MGQPDEPSTLDDPVLGSAAYLLLKAGHYVRLEFEAGLAELDLSARELLVLSFVATTEGLSQQELAARLGLDPTIVVGLVDGLEGRGLLVRTKDPEDRRRNILSLTRAGSALRTKAERSVRTIEDGFLAPLPADRRAELRAALHAVLVPRLPWLD